MGVVQHHVYFLFKHDNVVKIKILGKIKLLSYSGHLDKKKQCFEQYFPISYPSDMGDYR